MGWPERDPSFRSELQPFGHLERRGVKNAVSAGNIDNIKAATEKLTEVSYDVFGRVYQQQAQQNPQGGYQAQDTGNYGYEQPKQDDGVVDADYEVVDDNK